MVMMALAVIVNILFLQCHAGQGDPPGVQIQFLAGRGYWIRMVAGMDAYFGNTKWGGTCVKQGNNWVSTPSPQTYHVAEMVQGKPVYAGQVKLGRCPLGKRNDYWTKVTFLSGRSFTGKRFYLIDVDAPAPTSKPAPTPKPTFKPIRGPPPPITKPGDLYRARGEEKNEDTTPSDVDKKRGPKKGKKGPKAGKGPKDKGPKAGKQPPKDGQGPKGKKKKPKKGGNGKKKSDKEEGSDTEKLVFVDDLVQNVADFMDDADVNAPENGKNLGNEPDGDDDFGGDEPDVDDPDMDEPVKNEPGENDFDDVPNHDGYYRIDLDSFGGRALIGAFIVWLIVVPIGTVWFAKQYCKSQKANKYAKVNFVDSASEADLVDVGMNSEENQQMIDVNM